MHPEVVSSPDSQHHSLYNTATSLNNYLDTAKIHVLSLVDWWLLRTAQYHYCLSSVLSRWRLRWTKFGSIT